MMKLAFALLLATTTAYGHEILQCSPTAPETCKIKINPSHKRPSATYTFSDEVPFKICLDNNSIADCFKDESLLRQPFILAQNLENQAPVSILMIHGLSDGPYYNKPMGRR